MRYGGWMADLPRTPAQVRIVALQFAFDYATLSDGTTPLTPLELCAVAQKFAPPLIRALGNLPHRMTFEAEIQILALQFAMRQARHHDGVVRLSAEQVVGNSAMFADYIREGSVVRWLPPDPDKLPKCVKCGHPSATPWHKPENLCPVCTCGLVEEESEEDPGEIELCRCGHNEAFHSGISAPWCERYECSCIAYRP